MAIPVYEYGRKKALKKLGFLGAALRGIGSQVAEHAGQIGDVARRAVGPVAKTLGSPLQSLGNLGGMAEKAIGNKATSVLGQQGGDVVKRSIRDIPGDVAKQSVMGAGAMGVLGGGLNAAQAEEGHRGEAFMRGAGQGALEGAALGGATGVLGGAVKNLRREGLTREMMSQRGLSNIAGPKKLQEAVRQPVEERLNRGVMKNLDDIATGKGGLGTRGALQNVGGQVAQGASEWVLPSMVVPAGLGAGMMGLPNREEQEQSSQQERTAADQRPDLFPPMLFTGMLGGGITGAGAKVGLDVLEHKGHLPKGVLSKSLIKNLGPVAASVPGFVGGRALGAKAYPAPPVESVPEEVRELENIDMNKLMRYYHKSEQG